MKILTSAGNILDVKNMVQAIEILESINSPAITGSLTILDIDNILEFAPIIGQEYMSLIISNWFGRTSNNVLQIIRAINYGYKNSLSHLSLSVLKSTLS